jgi:hypothetical protein
MTSILVAFIMVAILKVPAPAQGKVEPPKGPAPRFVTIEEVNADKGELIVCEECLPHPKVTSRVITNKQKNRREEGNTPELGSNVKLRVYYYTTTHTLPLKKATIYTAGGKKLSEEEISRLKVGAMVLLSADGHPVEEEYLALIKPETLILVVDVEALPSPYESTESTDGMIKKLKK